MSYLVMECHPGYVVLLDEEGRFLKAANLRYETGQTMYDPVLMKETPERQRHTVRWISSGIAAIAACFLLFFGIGYYQNYLQPYSSIYLTINPEVQMELNRQGTVVGLTGTNEDGKTLLEGYDGKGKDKITVADELIDRAIVEDPPFTIREGGIIRKEIPMYACKVMRVCPKCGKATREAFKVENGAKVRVCKKCGETI